MPGKMIYCNKCGNPICKKETIEKADYVRIEKNWGYFSKKDGICERINICEQCYEEMIKGFLIPPEQEERKELI